MAHKISAVDDWRKDPKTGIEVEAAGGTRRDPSTGSTLEFKNDFYILHLRGDPYQRGNAHGKLLRDKIKGSGIIQYYSTLFLNLYRSSDLYRKIPNVMRKMVGEMLEWWFYSPLEKLFLDENRQELYGVADAAGFDRRDALRGVLAPDLMEHLAGNFFKASKETLGNYYLGGCSGVYVRGTALKDRRMALFARNMDFPGALVWRYPSLVFSHPSEHIDVLVKTAEGKYTRVKKQKQPYMYITTAGFPGHGLTGMNSSGIAMGSFVCLSKNISKREPIFLDFNHYLFTRTEDIGGIIHLLEIENLKSASPHTVVFADKAQSISIEVDSKKHIVRPMPKDFDLHVQTNHFLNPILKKREIEFPLEREDTIGRYRLLQEVLEDNYGELDIHRMIDVISCNLDLASQNTRLLGGDFPSRITTLSSVVFEMESGNFWVASGMPPGICFNKYMGFNFFNEIEGKSDRLKLPSYIRSSRPVLKGTSFIPVTDRMIDSLRLVSLSQEQLKRGKVRKAVLNVEKAVSLHTDPGYEYILGILYLMHGEMDKALATIRSVRDTYSFAPIKAGTLSLWEGRCLDILGRREEAKKCYLNALNDSSLVKHIRKVLKQSLRKPFKVKNLPRSIDYYLMGPLTY
jgi:hypothetical protein